MSAPPGRHSERAARALTVLAERDPTFAALALWVHHRDRPSDAAPLEVEGAPAWTDGASAFYAEGFGAAARDEQVGLAAHQIAHIAFRHLQRQRAMALRLGERFDPALFNLAADAIVNEMLLLAGYVLPRPCPRLVPLLEDALGEKTTAERAIGDWDVERLTLQLIEAGQHPPKQRKLRRGEGQSPVERAHAYARKAAHRPDFDPRAAEPGTADDQETAEEANWRQRLARALMEGRLAGRGLGALTLHIADIPESRIPWERHLRGLAARALRHDPAPSWQRPTGRWLASESEARRMRRPVPVFEPGRRRDQDAPRIVLGIDSSSSVDSTTLALFAAQVAGIGRRVGGAIHLMIFDEAVRSAEELRGTDWVRAMAKQRFAQGGGTDYADLFARAGALAPSALIVLTDLGAPMPEPPRFPVIWACPPGTRHTPSFGATVPLA